MKNKNFFLNTIYLNYIINFISLNIFIILIYLFNLKSLFLDIALFSSFVLLLTQVFSAHSRTLILSDDKRILISNTLLQRIIFSIPIIILSLFFISIYNIEDYSFAICILLTILLNWIYEIILTSKEIQSKDAQKEHIIISAIVFLLILYFLNINSIFFVKAAISIYNIFIIYQIYKFLLNNKIEFKLTTISLKNLFKKYYFSSLGSSLTFSAANFLFRYFIIKLAATNEISSQAILGFMFGSFPVSLFFHIFGASLVRNKIQFYKSKNVPLYFLGIFILCGLLLHNYSFMLSGNFLINTVFFSIIGTIPMILGLYERQKYVQTSKFKENFFYLDLLYGLSVITVVPIVYVTGIEELFSICFLLTGIISFIIFGLTGYLGSKKTLQFLLFLIPLPIFFNLFELFKLSNFMVSFDKLNQLPIPLSFIALIFLNLALLRKAKTLIFSIHFISLSFLISIFSIIFLGRLNFINFLNIGQFYLPMLALISGEIVGKLFDLRKFFLKTLVNISAFVIAIQIITSIYNMQDSVTSGIFKFKIYQLTEYTSTIFVLGICVYLWEIIFTKKKIIIPKNIFFTILLFAYTFLLHSYLVYIFLIFLSVTIYYIKKDYFIPIITIIISSLIILFHNKIYPVDFSLILNEYTTSYMVFINEIFYSSGNLLLGSNSNNQVYKISQGNFNFYLDFIYNFGLLSLIPLVYLIYKTISATYHQKNEVFKNKQNYLIYSILLFILFFDCFVRVSLKQPYIGIIFYFLWGICLSNLSAKLINEK